MAEWFKAAALKAVVGIMSTVGSNPTPTAIHIIVGEVAESVYCSGLLSRCGRKSTVGSNPTLSAIFIFKGVVLNK